MTEGIFCGSSAVIHRLQSPKILYTNYINVTFPGFLFNTFFNYFALTEKNLNAVSLRFFFLNFSLRDDLCCSV